MKALPPAFSFFKSSIIGKFFWRLTSAMHEHRTLEAHHLNAVLIYATRENRHDALHGPAFRLALMEHGALRVQRVARKYRMRRFHLVPAEIDNDLCAHRADAHSGQERKSEGRVDEQLLPLSLGGIRRVEMNLLRVHSQQSEPDIIDGWCVRGGARIRHQVRNPPSKATKSRVSGVLRPPYMS